MEVLELNGEKFVKASSIARDLGYTSDYVGQLCRSGKVDAQLVGRSWYVSEESIRSHKYSRYRSNKSKARLALKQTSSQSEPRETKESSPDDHIKITKPVSVKVADHNFYRKLKPVNTKYDEDHTELIPTLKERVPSKPPTELSVELADAKKVSVEKSNKPYKMEASKRPKIRFRGQVTIVEPTDAPEEKPKAKVTEPKLKPSIGTKVSLKQSENINVDKHPIQTKSKISSSTRSSNKLKVNQADITQTMEQSIPLKQGRPVSMVRAQKRTATKNGQLVVKKIVATKPAVKTGRATFVYISTSVLVALILGTGIILLENSVSTQGDSNVLSQTYSLNLSSVIDAFRAINIDISVIRDFLQKL